MDVIPDLAIVGLRLRSFRIRVMLQAAMNSSVDTAAPVSAAPAIPMLARVLELRPGDSNLVSVLTDLREFLLTRMVASNMRPGDEIFVADSGGTATPNTEVYIRKPSTRGADVYQVKAGYAALPKLDKREESFVRVQVPDSQMGIDAIHVPCTEIRDYFFAGTRTAVYGQVRKTSTTCLACRGT